MWHFLHIDRNCIRHLGNKSGSAKLSTIVTVSLLVCTNHPHYRSLSKLAVFAFSLSESTGMYEQHSVLYFVYVAIVQHKHKIEGHDHESCAILACSFGSYDLIEVSKRAYLYSINVYKFMMMVMTTTMTMLVPLNKNRI